jgi:hypothetical protein
MVGTRGLGESQNAVRFLCVVDNRDSEPIRVQALLVNYFLVALKRDVYFLPANTKPIVQVSPLTLTGAFTSFT